MTEETLNNFNYFGITRHSKLILSKEGVTIDHYDTTVHTRNLLRRVQFPEGETTLEELSKLEWFNSKVIIELIENGICKQVETIKQTENPWKKITNIDILPVADPLTPKTDYYVQVEVEGVTDGLYRSKALDVFEAEGRYAKIREASFCAINTKEWTWKENEHIPAKRLPETEPEPKKESGNRITCAKDIPRNIRLNTNITLGGIKFRVESINDYKGDRIPDMVRLIVYYYNQEFNRDNIQSVFEGDWVEVQEAVKKLSGRTLRINY